MLWYENRAIKVVGRLAIPADERTQASHLLQTVQAPRYPSFHTAGSFRVPADEH